MNTMTRWFGDAAHAFLTHSGSWNPPRQGGDPTCASTSTSAAVGAGEGDTPRPIVPALQPN